MCVYIFGMFSLFIVFYCVVIFFSSMQPLWLLLNIHAQAPTQKNIKIDVKMQLLLTCVFSVLLYHYRYITTVASNLSDNNLTTFP